MVGVDQTEGVQVRFSVTWYYSGILGVGKRIAREVHLRLQQYKLTNYFEQLSRNRQGHLDIQIEEITRSQPNSGGLIITMKGDSWGMGEFVKTILNEPIDDRTEAIKSLLKAELGDYLLVDRGVEADVNVLDFSLTRQP